jgi:hypothetical protein
MMIETRLIYDWEKERSKQASLPLAQD